MYSRCWMPNEERNFPSLLRPFTFSFLQNMSQVISFVWNWNNYFCVMKDFYYFSEEFIRMKLNSSLSNGKHLGLRNSRIGLQLGNYFLFQSVLPVFFASTVSTTLLFKLTYLPSFSIVKLDDFRIRVVTWSRRVAATFVVIIYISLFSIAMKQLFRYISSTSICIVYRRSPWFGRPLGIDFKSYRFVPCEIKKILVFPSFAFQVKGIWKSTCFRFLFSLVLGCLSFDSVEWIAAQLTTVGKGNEDDISKGKCSNFLVSKT
jgi:hypothetical protein